MEFYKAFIKAGEILIAPSLEYQDQCILKCLECDEYHKMLDTFWSHCLSHYKIRQKKEPAVVYATNDDLNDDTIESEKIENGNDHLVPNYEVETETDESFDEMDNDPLNLYKEEVEDDAYPTTKEEREDNIEDIKAEYIGFRKSAQKSASGRDLQMGVYVRKFFKCEKYVIALISAYKKIPHLWDFNFPMQMRKRDERIKAFKEIAIELKNTINIQTTTYQVSALIGHLRHNYRERLKCQKDLDDGQETPRKECKLPESIWDRLEFLRPYIKNNSIALLDPQQEELVPEQVLQILAIYKQCPFLWNTDLMEHYCHNKREEELDRMTELIEQEMDIEVEKDNLRKYLNSIHLYFSKKQRIQIGLKKIEEVRSEYFEHMQFLHGHVGSFKCSECDKNFQTPIRLKEHMYKHDGVMHLHCTMCLHKFRTAQAYTAHVRRHMGDLAIECNECGRRFLKPAELRIHMRSHTGDKPYFCELCGTSFRQQQELLHHTRRHQKKYMLFCPTCSKGFYTKSKMRTHMAIHDDKRNFVCGMCGKAFKTKKTLQNHELTHEEGLNHKCDICGKCFKNKINLGHHKRTHINKLKEFNTLSIDIFNDFAQKEKIYIGYLITLGDAKQYTSNVRKKLVHIPLH